MQIQLTSDGSHTLYVPELDEHYHSVNGAVQESRHVYIDAGLNQSSPKKVCVLEMGFGTGLNALLTALEAEKQQRDVHYITLEKYPVAPELLTQLNYRELSPELFDKIHQAEWNELHRLTSSFSIQKVETDFADYAFPGNYDVIYYDAFAPDKQADVWSQALFDMIYRQTNPGGVLTTYCAKGQIRRMLQSSGFVVERIPGPPGKREMLRARR